MLMAYDCSPFVGYGRCLGFGLDLGLVLDLGDGAFVGIWVLLLVLEDLHDDQVEGCVRIHL